jgi:hypothetical protein
MSGKSHDTTLCWKCQKAVLGCSWSRDFEPVPGWTAEPTTILVNDGGNRVTHSFKVIACPEFQKDKPHKAKRGRRYHAAADFN